MSRRNEIKHIIESKILRLQTLADVGSGKSMMAELRKGVGKAPGELPFLLGAVLEDMPEEFYSQNGEATKEEWACYTALTLFAWHQQGYDMKKECMHSKDRISIGDAARVLKQQEGDSNAEERILKRIQMITTAMDMNGFSLHLRNLIKLFASNKIKLNYGILAADIYTWQFEENKRNINLIWGQDYYKETKEEKENE